MIVTFISQCEKNALKKTRRVLDSFANRIGDNTWQTIITQEGLNAVKKLLKKTASKSTAVSCHWIRSSRRVELMWIVGNRDRFNSEGVVPVHITADDSLILKNEYRWKNIETIALIGSLAGLFHDIGKANNLFQNKLNQKIKTKGYEPYRHEWVSLRLFCAFVAEKRDKEWLKELVEIDNKTEKIVLEKLEKDGITQHPNKIFEKLPPLAKVIAWLIVSHHRLPIYPSNYSNPPQYEYIDRWLEENFEASWNAINHKLSEWSNKEIEDTWSFKKGTPLRSATWQIEASELAKRVLATEQVFEKDWFNQRFILHLSRLVLMLSDHYYSPKKPTTKWQDRNYDPIANTYNNPKQKLDEHNIGVAQNAYNFAQKLPRLREELPTVTLPEKILKPQYKNREEKERFKWQDRAFRLSKKLQKESLHHGFFGINMASTGRGKTLANAKIMYGLADKREGCRFNIALGLRTLTLQTGEALGNLLELSKEDYAVLIGSEAVKKLYEAKKKELEKEQFYSGSESSEELIEDTQTISYGRIPDNIILTKWLERSLKLQKLIDAPLLISTIDHLMGATEGVRGGKQIGPMLRLLTSDLVLDEPDDFGLEDLPALCRLVNWTAMLGGKVLLSTATMPPALANALFQAYQAGWEHYSEVNGMSGVESKISCAWFDEFSTHSDIVGDKKEFFKEHDSYIKKRVANLTKERQILRRAKLIPIESSQDSVYKNVATTFLDNIYKLHENHHQVNNQHQRLSIGLIRMAHIDPLVSVSKEMLSLAPKEDTAIYYCIYHSRFPLAMRSVIEEKLDRVLTRYKQDEIWNHKEIKDALAKSKKRDHIFVVLATSVAEVGRDHDYDWIVAEPSSMRSLIQLAGRLQRHRKEEPLSENFLILSKNINALKGKEVAYTKPGFETKGGKGNNRRLFKEKDLSKLLDESDLKEINATPRIEFKGQFVQKEFYSNFVELEQLALFQRLLGVGNEKDNATYWWREEATWSAEIQRREPFRTSRPDANYALCLEENQEIWCRENTTVRPKIFQEVAEIAFENIEVAKGNYFWFDMSITKEYNRLSKIFNLTIKEISEQFGQLRLEINDNPTEWKYNKFLGVYR